jgi:imidazolonepropionase
VTDLLLTGIGQLVTNRPGAEDLVGAVPDAAIAVEAGRVAWAGPEADLPAPYRALPTVDCGGAAVLPGFVDAHTHLVFAGDRAEEFARRLRGETYQEVLASGGGIRATVRATREASFDGLVAGATERAGRLLASGVTTAEVKSGYGLDVATERRQLEAIAAVDLPIDLVATFLGAHVMPANRLDDRESFLRLLEEEMLPACAPHATYCDVFCDEGAFTPEEAERVLRAGQRHGLRPRLHANELGHTGGVAVAEAVGAVSADHLAYLDADEIAALRRAGTVAVLLPATTFSLRSDRYAPGPELFAAGVPVALGTDCNPGTSYTEGMGLVIALACLQMGLTPEQAVWAATRGGALALEMDDRGWIGTGALADLIVLDAPGYEHLPYRPATNLVARVYKAGVLA